MKHWLWPAALASLLAAPAGARGDVPMTKTATIVLHLNAPANVAFPLFDPVNETKWDSQWKPRLLGDRVQEGLVFLVGNGDERSTWLIDRYDPARHRIAYVAAARSTLTRIAIRLRSAQNGCMATVTYTKTALDDEGRASVEHFAEHFPSEGPHWESAINAALAASERY